MTMWACQEWRSEFAAGSLAVLLSAVAFLGCSTGGRAAVAHQESIQVQEQRRTFTVYTPDDAGPASLPILIVLHGGLGNGRYVARQTGLTNYVDRDKFVAVFPDGARGHWNDGRSTTSSWPDDVTFLRQAIAEVAQKWGGDPKRVFLAGISSGGMMAQRMACDASDIVTAIGVVVANMPTDLIDHCRPSQPVPVVLFNGTRDPINPWSGGSIASSAMLDTPGGQVVSAMDTFDFWTRTDGCGPPVVDSMSGTDVKRHTGTNCGSGSEVALYEIEGGGHGWPGGVPPGPIESRIVGYVTSDISASAIIVQFFHRYGF
jgi:polyhydroxybutyrate depolymerase